MGVAIVLIEHLCGSMCVFSLSMTLILLVLNRGSIQINLQSFIHDHGWKQAWVNKQQMDMHEARKIIFLGQAWVNDQRTKS